LSDGTASPLYSYCMEFADARATWLRILATFTCVLVLGVFTPVSWPDTLVMPRELVDFAHSNGCTPIDNFFERPGMVNPPFVYGWLPGDPADSAAFWCKKTEKSAKPYKLIFKVRDPKQMAGCPTTIEWWSARGLSIEIRTRLALSDFHSVVEPKRSGPKSVVADAKVLVDSYDGVSNVFYCYGGQWFWASFE
jgi:hypothetical protein